MINYQVLDAAICPVPDDSEIDFTIIDSIVKNTHNTWQKARSRNELYQNTVMGKRAEFAFEKLISETCVSKFLSYDKFREDHFKKHAPFDGLLFSPDLDESIIDSLVAQINNEIRKGNYSGSISSHLRKQLEEKNIFTVEIKSSHIKQNELRGVSQNFPRSLQDKKTIIRNINQRDYFIYPHYLRSSNSVSTFYEYAELERNKQPDLNSLGNQRALAKLLRIEYENACTIYTRLYFDDKCREIYVPGYLLKEQFFREPIICKMPGKKSGSAVYFIHSITEGNTVFKIDSNTSLWNRTQEEIEKGLFANHVVNCPTCGLPLKICKNENSKRYFFRCFNCETNMDLSF